MDKKLRCRFCLRLCAAAAALSAPAWAATEGQLMELTMHVQEHIEGMAALPAHSVSRQVCLQSGTFDARAFAQLQSSAKCKMTHYEQQGDVVTFDQVCSGPQSAANHGVFHLTGGTDFTGTMRTSMEAAGHVVTVDTAYTGTKVGTCNPEQQASR